ncbi:demethylmenaquinone methyltransferase-like [Saccostrea echinata]|uniref:demethylmenaquinone methyltransferase-like n=1 Tax=Saccostrea echinata TaxID=191078 RepID=UPI002A8264DF|nr:demethylmenaquinone methyltransferase-like [Saccostrea echinata]
MSEIAQYNEISKLYDSTREAAEAHILKSLMENFTGKSVKDMDIIDIGCGTGNYSKYFLQFEPHSLVLMDASEGMISKAKAKLSPDPAKTSLSFKQVVLPEMPYDDNSFDAAMINLVLHHLEKNPDGKSFPKVVQTLKEAYRILKPGGVLTITTVTPEQLDGNWFSKLVPQNTERWHKRLLTHKQMKTILEESGFKLVSAQSTLMASYHPNHDNIEGPLEKSWRDSISFWGTCTESEIQDMIQKVTKMKNEGTLQEFYEKHEKIHIFGALEILAAKKEVK